MITYRDGKVLQETKDKLKIVDKISLDKKESKI